MSPYFYTREEEAAEAAGEAAALARAQQGSQTGAALYLPCRVLRPSQLRAMLDAADELARAGGSGRHPALGRLRVSARDLLD